MKMMDDDTKLIKADIELYERSSCMLKDIIKTDSSVQTDNYDFKEVITAIVNKRLNQVQEFATEELQRKFEKVEEENKNLKRREMIYEKRLMQLEERSKKRRNINQCAGPTSKKHHEEPSTLNMQEDVIDNIAQQPTIFTNDNTQEINEFCPPLFRPGQKKTHTISYQKEKIPTQLVIPMQQEAKKDSQMSMQKMIHHNIPRNKPSTVSRASTAQMQQLRSNEQLQRAGQMLSPPGPMTRSIEVSMQLQQVPVQLLAAPLMNARQYIRYPIAPQRPAPPNQGARLARVPLRGPPPNHNLFEYRPLSKLNHPQRLPAYQIRTVPPHEIQMQQSPQAIHYTAVSTHPPPPYTEPKSFSRLPQLTASITSDANSIILTWDCFNATNQLQRNVDVYFLFAFHTLDLSIPPPADVSAWKRIGAIKSLPLPIACTLTQTFDGHNYFFAVVATDNQGRMGELSNPCALKVTL